MLDAALVMWLRCAGLVLIPVFFVGPPVARMWSVVA